MEENARPLDDGAQRSPLAQHRQPSALRRRRAQQLQKGAIALAARGRFIAMRC